MFYIQKRNVTDLLYHEYLPYFFGNDLEYIRARDGVSTESETPTFLNVTDGYFAAEMLNDVRCLVKVSFNKIRKTVGLSWQDNFVNGKSCGEPTTPTMYQCENDNLIRCVANTNRTAELVFSMKNNNSMNFGWSAIGDAKIISMFSGSFVRIEKETRLKETTLFTGTGFFTDLHMNYSEMCQKAFDEAEKLALQSCEKQKLNNSRKCETVNSEPIYSSSSDRTLHCLIKVTVKSIPLSE